jgi:hypothetical protein
MTPKKKAGYLVDRYFNGKKLLFESLSFIQAKECALIAVDEIINSDPTEPYPGGYYEIEQDKIDCVIRYWQEVKQEIDEL